MLISDKFEVVRASGAGKSPAKAMRLAGWINCDKPASRIAPIFVLFDDLIFPLKEMKVTIPYDGTPEAENALLEFENADSARRTNF